MPNHTVKVRKQTIKPILDLTFPEYRGRKCTVEFTDRVSFYDTNWSGGTRNQYAAVKADGTHARLSVPAPWINPVEGATLELPIDVLLVKHTVFCGKDLGITVYANPLHLPRWLPAPS